MCSEYDIACHRIIWFDRHRDEWRSFCSTSSEDAYKSASRIIRKCSMVNGVLSTMVIAYGSAIMMRVIDTSDRMEDKDEWCAYGGPTSTLDINMIYHQMFGVEKSMVIDGYCDGDLYRWIEPSIYISQ